MNINNILTKSFIDLTADEQKQIANKLLERMTLEFQTNDRQGIYATTQKMMAYNSNKIEGSTLTLDQTASLFDTGTILANNEVFRAKDVEEMSGHFSMFNEMLKTLNLSLSEPLIKVFHYRLKAGVFEDYANGYVAGEYKQITNMVSDITTVKPSEVEAAVIALLNDYNSVSTHSLIDLAKFHAEFEKIHPFQDGNGRTGRMILFRESLRSHQIPIIVKDNNKVDYYHALHKAQVDNAFGDLENFFKASQTEYYSVLQEFLYEHERKQVSSIDELLKAAVAETEALKTTNNRDSLTSHNDLDER